MSHHHHHHHHHDDEEEERYDRGDRDECCGRYEGEFRRQEFHIVSHMNQKVISIEGGMPERHAKLVMMPKEPHARNQLWYFDDEGCIRSVIGDYVIEAEESGRHLRLTTHCDDERHHWSHAGKQIINRGTGECMDIRGESHHDGAEVISYRYNDQHNQHWSLEYDA